MKTTNTTVLEQFIALTLCAALPLYAVAPDNSYKISYDGGSVSGLKAGVGLRLVMDAARIRIMRDKQEVAVIPVAAITEVSYGQDVHRRVGAAIGLAVVSLGVGALMLLSKSKKHYIGLTWDDRGSKGGFAFQADKNDYRAIIR